MVTVIAMIVILTSCSKTAIKQVTIPESLLRYTGMTADEMCKSFKESGDKYCTEVYVDGKNVVMELTDEQFSRLIADNNQWADELTQEFESAGDQYKVIGSKDYSKVSFVFDENMDIGLQIEAMYGITGMYGFNYVLVNDENWEIDFSVINCHTGKTVVSGKIPDDVIKLGGDDWQRSY